MIVIRYTGKAHERKITEIDFKELGIDDQETVVWNRANGYVEQVSDAAGIYLMTQADFVEMPDRDFGSYVGASIPNSQKGAPQGVASLDANGKIPLHQLPEASPLVPGIVRLAGDLAGDWLEPQILGLGDIPVLEGGVLTPAHLPAATDDTQGAVRLAGDLGGTAAAPTVPGLGQRIPVSQKGTANGVAALDGSAILALGHFPFVSVLYPILAMMPELIMQGAITRNANQAITSAPVKWPDPSGNGLSGVYTALVLSTDFPGATDSYVITCGPRSYTQPTVTRNAAGQVINRPAILVG